MPRTDVSFCRTSTTSSPSSDQPQDLPGGWTVRKSDVLKSDALCVTGLAGFCHAAHVSSCPLHWARVVGLHRSADPSLEYHGQEQDRALQQLEGGLVHQSFKKLRSQQCVAVPISLTPPRPTIPSALLCPRNLGRKVFSVKAVAHPKSTTVSNFTAHFKESPLSLGEEVEKLVGVLSKQGLQD